MQGRGLGRDEVGVDWLLAGSEAFQYFANELAAAHQFWDRAGAAPGVLSWARHLAELPEWWCGRLESEAYFILGGVVHQPCDSITVSDRSSTVEAIGYVTCQPAAENRRCLRHRWRRP